MKSINSVSIEEAVNRIMRRFSSSKISKNYDLIVYILQCIYAEENVEQFFPENVLEDNIANRIQRLCKSKVKNLDDLQVVILKSERKVAITGNGHFNKGECNYSSRNPHRKRDAENSIKREVEIYYGFTAYVEL